jgi:FecR protein
MSVDIFAHRRHIQKNANSIMRIFQAALAAAVCLGLATTKSVAQSQKEKTGYATCVRVEGIVTYSLGTNQPEHPLVAGQYLLPGSIVFTKDNGVCDLILGKAIDLPQAKWSPDRISLAHDSPVRGYVTYRPSADQNAIRLTPNSTLAIDRLKIMADSLYGDSVIDTELDLQKGKIFASVRKLKGASQYIIKLPNGIAGVRGTLFSLGADGSCACYESTGGGVIIAVTPTSGADIGNTQTYVVQPGQVLDPVTKQVVNISPEVNTFLQKVFDALRATYFQEVNYEYDHTGCFISPTSGGKGGIPRHQ